MDKITLTDSDFTRVGTVIDQRALSETDRAEMIRYYLEQTEAPEEGNIYVADDPGIYNLSCINRIKALHPAEEVQVGYCHGNSTKVNALEWHDSNEVIFAATDCVLYLGAPTDLDTSEDKKTFDTCKLYAVSLQAGDCIRLYPQVLHFAPTKVNDQPYRTMILLPKGTNMPLAEKGENHLFMKNKYLIAHKDRQDLIDKGAWPGVIGENYDWNNM